MAGQRRRGRLALRRHLDRGAWRGRGCKLEKQEAFMATAKQVALEIVGSLPDDCTLKDAAYRLYLRQLVEEAREDFRQGRTFTQDEVEREAAQWLEP